MNTLKPFCAVVPSFNHSAKLAQISRALLAKNIAVIVVDDASTEEHSMVLQQVSNASNDIHLVTHHENQGKGGAVITGLLMAQKLGYSHALQIGSDGQHDLNDINSLVDLSEKYPDALISGKPIYDDSIPKGRLWGRSITHFWVYIETLSLQVKDTMCGFRVYPLEATCQLIKQVSLGKRMDFDIEIIESHHRHKVDAPSGTALMLGEAAAEGRGVDLKDVSDSGRDGITGARRRGDIGFTAIRGGDIIGEHDVMFACDGEQIILRHKATDRSLFAKGALKAAIWGQDQKPGEYDMFDVLGL